MPMQPILGRGQFLIAHPSLTDPNFRRSVVLLCNHDENGSFGLVINHATDMSVAEALGKTETLADPSAKIFKGGPVKNEQLMMLHLYHTEIPHSIEIIDHVRLGGEPEILQEKLASEAHPGEAYRLFSGYSGWGRNQLRQEIEQGAWIVCPARTEFIFEVEPDQIWQEVLRSLGGPFVLMAADPNLN